MKIIRVQYTVKPEFASQNQANIQKVMEALRAAGSTDFKYSTCVLEDGQTFMHLAIFRNEGTKNPLSEIEEFKQFQAALKASQPLSGPKPENLSLVGASFDWF